MRAFAAAGSLSLAMFAAEAAFAQKQGGILKMYSPDSPASMSIHEEATIVSQRPMMGVFNNLVMFDQHVKQNSLASIVPDLATGWSWNEDGTELTLPLHQGVRWHDGKPFTAKDVKCTWDLLTGKGSDKLRVNPRKASYRNLEEVTTNGDYEVAFHLKRPQPSCGTSALGPYRTLLGNREKPPFDNAELRRAMALSLDRKAFIDVITEGQGDIGGVMQPPPEGEWGMPPGMLKELPGYDPDVQKNRREARQIMQQLGYGPDNRLKVKLTVRDLPYLRDPAVLLIDQLKEVYIDGELDTVDTTIYLPKLMRRDFVGGVGPAGAGSAPCQSV